MWGTLQVMLLATGVHQFIPVCGEHFPHDGPEVRGTGSSPRMWGTRSAELADVHHLRFIPTHVGNTPQWPCPRGASSVHPHACGEHPASIGQPRPSDGSSPRMWGTRVCSLVLLWHHRFIPTHVGNTGMSVPVSIAQSVHPHACGEHPSLTGQALYQCGSSPRMWGTLLFRCGDDITGRFIPTHVGNTRSGRRSCARHPVHPHACGEHAARPA